MKIDRAIEILENMDDGYTFHECELCNNEDNEYDEKEGRCKSKTCEYLQAIEVVLKDRERLIANNKYTKKEGKCKTYKKNSLQIFKRME